MNDRGSRRWGEGVMDFDWLTTGSTAGRGEVVANRTIQKNGIAEDCSDVLDVVAGPQAQ